MNEPYDVIGCVKEEVDTPCLLVDVDLLEGNIARMAEHAVVRGKGLRPHMKTHKCLTIARMQMAAGAVGVCAAKVSEAAGLIEGGVDDVLITAPVVGRMKIEKLMWCKGRSEKVAVVVDNANNARDLNDAAKERGVVLDVLIDLDGGLGRTGVAYGDAVELGKVVDGLVGLRLCGVQCYAGHLQHIQSYEERRCESLECMSRAAEVVEAFEAAGMRCDVFTGTGTGTYDIDCEVERLTDMQVGSYVFMDAEYLAVESKRDVTGFAGFDTSLTLMSTVVSANHEGYVTIDAGLKSLYHHGGMPRVVKLGNQGLMYDWFGDEYGKISGGEERIGLELGQKVELVVSHCDPTVNLFDWLYVVRDGRVVDIWRIDLRGCSQ